MNIIFDPYAFGFAVVMVFLVLAAHQQPFHIGIAQREPIVRGNVVER